MQIDLRLQKNSSFIHNQFINSPHLQENEALI